jgi:hypothetical protein
LRVPEASSVAVASLQAVQVAEVVVAASTALVTVLQNCKSATKELPTC